MAENEKTQEKGFGKFCEGMRFADMMRKMMAGKQEGKSFDCAEMIGKMMEAKKTGSLNCAEMMGKMMAGKEGTPFNYSEMMAKMTGRAAKEEEA